MNKPFEQEIFDNYYIRVFSKDVEVNELKWHSDNENRKVTILEGDGWEFQIDDELPINLKSGDVIRIPKGIHHRIKRGVTDLKIKIEFYD
jgi:cupin superfamily acireductone dioxygenase involved in methionine salvage